MVSSLEVATSGSCQPQAYKNQMRFSPRHSELQTHTHTGRQDSSMVVTPTSSSLSSTNPSELSRHQGAQTGTSIPGTKSNNNPYTASIQNIKPLKPCGYLSAGPLLICLSQSRGCQQQKELKKNNNNSLIHSVCGNIWSIYCNYFKLFYFYFGYLM